MEFTPDPMDQHSNKLSVDSGFEEADLGDNFWDKR